MQSSSELCGPTYRLENANWKAVGEAPRPATEQRSSGQNNAGKPGEETMKRGVWHQLGYNSQSLVEEQLQSGIGVGAIFSPSDLRFELAKSRSTTYRDLGADVLISDEYYLVVNQSIIDVIHGSFGWRLTQIYFTQLSADCRCELSYLQWIVVRRFYFVNRQCWQYAVSNLLFEGTQNPCVATVLCDSPLDCYGFCCGNAPDIV